MEEKKLAADDKTQKAITILSKITLRSLYRGHGDVRFRGEFRAPLGVRKSPRNESAVQGRWLWGFRVFGKHGGAGLAPGGGFRIWNLTEYFSSFAEPLAPCRAIHDALSEVCGRG